MKRLLKRAGQVALGLVGLTIGIIGVLALREATLSTHQPVAPDSQIELVVRTHVNGIESTRHELSEITEAQLTMCQLEVSSEIVGDLEPLGGNEFRVVLQPSMDDTNRKQFRGCLTDFLLDHVQHDVVKFEDLPRDGSSAARDG